MMRVNNFNKSTTGISLELNICFNKHYVDQHFNVIARDYNNKGELIAILVTDNYYKNIDDFVIKTLNSNRLGNVNEITEIIAWQYDNDVDNINSWVEFIKNNPRVELIKFYREVFKYESIKSIDAIYNFLDDVLDENPIKLGMTQDYYFTTDIYYVGNIDVELIEKALSKPALAFDVYIDIYNKDISHKVYSDMIDKLKNKYKHYEIETTQEELIDLFKQAVLDNTENKYKDIVTEQLETYFN